MWWHPSRGRDLTVVRWELKTRPPHVVLRLPGGSGLRVPLSWTNAGPMEAQPARRLRFTSWSLLELTALVESLRKRSADGCVGRRQEEDFDEAAVTVEHRGGAGTD